MQKFSLLDFNFLSKLLRGSYTMSHALAPPLLVTDLEENKADHAVFF
jgi:hypothetical protein